jgi:hypothetical protein
VTTDPGIRALAAVGSPVVEVLDPRS